MAGIKKAVSDYYNGFCEYMATDTKGVEIGIYTLSGIIFAVAYHKIRPITKFGKPSDIPKHFIRQRLRQYGSIEAVDPSSKGGPLLLINHRPPLPVPSNKLLPVKLSGISVNANGYSWLQTVAVGSKVEFIPIACNSNSAECQVFLVCPKNKMVHLDISQALLSLGFGKLSDPPRNLSDQELKKYFKNLSKTEAYAKEERMGLWSQLLPPKPWPIRKSKEVLRSLILSILPAQHRLPELVR